MTKRKLNCNLIIDFDSTFAKLEGLEELAKIALNGNGERKKIIEEIERITNLGMEGKIAFSESLCRRLQMLPAKRRHVEDLVGELRNNITDSVEENKDFFRENADQIYIISGGFKNFIWPVVSRFGIKEGNILANEFVFNEKGDIVGADQENVLTQDGGKTKAVEDLNLDGKIVVIGDGYTDYQIKESGTADIFCAFCENARRDLIAQKADFVLERFDQLPEEFFI